MPGLGAQLLEEVVEAEVGAAGRPVMPKWSANRFRKSSRSTAAGYQRTLSRSCVGRSAAASASGCAVLSSTSTGSSRTRRWVNRGRAPAEWVDPAEARVGLAAQQGGRHGRQVAAGCGLHAEPGRASTACATVRIGA